MDGNRTQRTPVDPDGLMEFSVVFTDRSLNSMSQSFQAVMRDISGMLKEVYAADHVAVVPCCQAEVARQLPLHQNQQQTPNSAECRCEWERQRTAWQRLVTGC